VGSRPPPRQRPHLLVSVLGGRWNARRPSPRPARPLQADAGEGSELRGPPSLTWPLPTERRPDVRGGASGRRGARRSYGRFRAPRAARTTGNGERSDLSTEYCATRPVVVGSRQPSRFTFTRRWSPAAAPPPDSPRSAQPNQTGPRAIVLMTLRPLPDKTPYLCDSSRLCSSFRSRPRCGLWPKFAWG
jgi:hypothetical protein